MNVEDMKNILAQKLKDEKSYFTKADIDIKKHGKTYQIIVKGFEHIPFRMELSHNEEDFEYVVAIFDTFDNCNIIFLENPKKYDIEDALMQLGYHIAMCF